MKKFLLLNRQKIKKNKTLKINDLFSFSLNCDPQITKIIANKEEKSWNLSEIIQPGRRVLYHHNVFLNGMRSNSLILKFNENTTSFNVKDDIFSKISVNGAFFDFTDILAWSPNGTFLNISRIKNNTFFLDGSLEPIIDSSKWVSFV